MSFKICANLSFMFQESASLLEKYALAKQSGFTAVECAFPYNYTVDEVKKAKESADIRQVLINTYPGDLATELGFAAIPGKEEQFRDSLDLAITYAKALNCQKIHIMSGKVSSWSSANDETYKSNLQYAVKIFEKEKIVGLIEPISPIAVPEYYMNSFEKGIGFVREINSPNLRLQLDFFHLQLINGNLTNNVKSMWPYIGHIQIAQVPNRHEPDSYGEINYSYIFDLLRKLNYSEWIGLEYKPAGETTAGLGWLKMLEYELLKKE